MKKKYNANKFLLRPQPKPSKEARLGLALIMVKTTPLDEVTLSRIQQMELIIKKRRAGGRLKSYDKY